MSRVLTESQVVEAARQNDRGLCASHIYGDGKGGAYCSRRAEYPSTNGFRYCWHHRYQTASDVANDEERVEALSRATERERTDNG